MCPSRVLGSGLAGQGDRGFRNPRQEATIRSAEAEVVSHGTWRSPVAHCNGVAGVAGSNPAVPTENERANWPARSLSGRRDLAVAPRRGLGAFRSNPGVARRGGLGRSGQVSLVPKSNGIGGDFGRARLVFLGAVAKPAGRYSWLVCWLRLSVMGDRFSTVEA